MTKYNDRRETIRKANIYQKESQYDIFISDRNVDEYHYNRCFKSIGYISEIKDKGIKDPVAYYQAQVKKVPS